MADQLHVVHIANAMGEGKHFTKEFDNLEDAHALSSAFNTARGQSKAIMVDGDLIMPEALSNVVVREVVDFDKILKEAEDKQKAIKEERKQAAEREAESLRSRAESLTSQADGKTSEYEAAHSTGATTDAEGAGSKGSA